MSVPWHVQCLCNHSSIAHGLEDYEAIGKIADAPCTECGCRTFEEDPCGDGPAAYFDDLSDAAQDGPWLDSDSRPGELSA